MKEAKKHEQEFELRSEKVRSIVGQIPSSLVRYGITIIGIILICLFVVVYFLPYKHIYSGMATVYETSSTQTDSIDTILLRFENKRPKNINEQKIYIQSTNGKFIGRIITLSVIRDTLDRQKAICRFKSNDIKSVENQTVDFNIVDSSSNILQKMLGGS
jgi:hypothetical protein